MSVSEVLGSVCVTVWVGAHSTCTALPEAHGGICLQNLHLDQLQDEDEGLRFFLQLVQVWVAQAVVGKHVGHAAGVHVPVHWVLALCNATQALGNDRVESGVLGAGQTVRADVEMYHTLLIGSVWLGSVWGS